MIAVPSAGVRTSPLLCVRALIVDTHSKLQARKFIARIAKMKWNVKMWMNIENEWKRNVWKNWLNGLQCVSVELGNLLKTVLLFMSLIVAAVLSKHDAQL